jgi:hypothetical protein
MLANRGQGIFVEASLEEVLESLVAHSTDDLGSECGFEPHDSRWITGVLVGVDDSPRRMVLSAQGVGEKALSCCRVAFSREKEIDRRTGGVNSPV